MSDTIESLRHKLSSAGDLQSVVRSMKALAASSIGQYEKSVSALADYYRTVELGLGACLRNGSLEAMLSETQSGKHTGKVTAIVFGSDQGLVGKFNDVIADYAIEELAALTDESVVWAVGERIHERLIDAGLKPKGLFPVPNSVKAITPLVGRIQLECETHQSAGGGLDGSKLHIFHNRPTSSSQYEPTSQRLLPLDARWQRDLTEIPWPTKLLPEVMGSESIEGKTLGALIREYLFISLFRACAESLASENASRLAAMQRADKNIKDLLEDLHSEFHRLRQSGIDEELFDVVSGYESVRE